MRLYELININEVIKLSLKKNNPKTEEFMDKYYKMTQVHPLNPSSRISRDGKSTAEIRPMGDHIHISAIQTLAPKERSGSASNMVMMLVTLADKTGVPLRLNAKPYGNIKSSLNKAQLKAWYKRKGFVSVKGNEMEYVPSIDVVDETAAGVLTKQNTTADVKKGTLRKMAKGFGFNITDKGIPPRISKDSFNKS